MSDMSLKIEAFKIYQDLKKANAPKELLDKSLSIVQSFDSGFENVELSREERQLASEAKLDTVRAEINEVDSIIKNLVDAGAPENLLKQAEEFNDISSPIGF